MLMGHPVINFWNIAKNILFKISCNFLFFDWLLGIYNTFLSTWPKLGKLANLQRHINSEACTSIVAYLTMAPYCYITVGVAVKAAVYYVRDATTALMHPLINKHDNRCLYHCSFLSQGEGKDKGIHRLIQDPKNYVLLKFE